MADASKRALPCKLSSLVLICAAVSAAGKFLTAVASKRAEPLKPSSLVLIVAPVSAAASTTRLVSAGVIARKVLVPASASFRSAKATIPLVSGSDSGNFSSGTKSVLPTCAHSKTSASICADTSLCVTPPEDSGGDNGIAIICALKVSICSAKSSKFCLILTSIKSEVIGAPEVVSVPKNGVFNGITNS